MIAEVKRKGLARTFTQDPITSVRAQVTTLAIDRVNIYKNTTVLT
jgi:hypothetical protein